MLGTDLARSLGALRGDKIALVAPQGVVTPAGVIPRLKQFTVVGIFEAGIVDADAGLALVHMRDAQTLYQMGDAASGVRLKLDDLFAAREVAYELLAKLPRDVFASDWTRSHANFFRAVEIEKRMMFLILGLIVLVAAINIISTLVMAVTDKQADIAILRTLGAAPGSILQIFMVQGMVLGVVGTLIGVLGRHRHRAQHRRHRPGDRARLQHQVPVEGRLPDPGPALGPAGERRDFDRGDGARALLPRHDLPELARRARQPGGSPAV